MIDSAVMGSKRNKKMLFFLLLSINFISVLSGKACSAKVTYGELFRAPDSYHKISEYYQIPYSLDYESETMGECISESECLSVGALVKTQSNQVKCPEETVCCIFLYEKPAYQYKTQEDTNTRKFDFRAQLPVHGKTYLVGQKLGHLVAADRVDSEDSQGIWFLVDRAVGGRAEYLRELPSVDEVTVNVCLYTDMQKETMDPKYAMQCVDLPPTEPRSTPVVNDDPRTDPRMIWYDYNRLRFGEIFSGQSCDYESFFFRIFAEGVHSDDCLPSESEANDWLSSWIAAGKGVTDLDESAKAATFSINDDAAELLPLLNYWYPMLASLWEVVWPGDKYQFDDGYHILVRYRWSGGGLWPWSLPHTSGQTVEENHVHMYVKHVDCATVAGGKCRERASCTGRDWSLATASLLNGQDQDGTDLSPSFQCPGSSDSIVCCVPSEEDAFGQWAANQLDDAAPADASTSPNWLIPVIVAGSVVSLVVCLVIVGITLTCLLKARRRSRQPSPSSSSPPSQRQHRRSSTLTTGGYRRSRAGSRNPGVALRSQQRLSRSLAGPRYDQVPI